MTKEEIREMFIPVWGNSKRMLDYCVKEFSDIAIIDGKRVLFTKPRIETSFCFDDSFDYDGAVRMADHARTSEDYFRKENLKQFDELLESIDDWRMETFIVPRYREDAHIYTPRWAYKYDLDDYPSRYADWIKLTDEGKEILRQAIIKEKEKFKKRVNTYLKRYGLTKVKSWTYWGMA